VVVRVNAHTDAQRRRRRFNVGRVGDCSYRRAEEEEEEKN